jgi:hypothetical protein
VIDSRDHTCFRSFEVFDARGTPEIGYVTRGVLQNSQDAKDRKNLA